jgi:hypothetical protein
MRYVILDRKEGVFLGTHVDESLDPEGVVFVLWSKDNVFSCHKAYSFENKSEATIFAETTLKRWPLAQVASVKTEDKYVDVIDLLKSGYGKYTHDMIDCIPCSDTVH